MLSEGRDPWSGQLPSAAQGRGTEAGLTGRRFFHSTSEIPESRRVSTRNAYRASHPAGPTAATGAGFTVLVALARSAREAARRHPGAFSSVLTRPVATAGAAEIRAAVHDLLRDAGVGVEHVERLERIVTTAVLGLAAGQASDRFAHHSPEALDEDFGALITFVEAGLGPFCR